MPKYLNFGDTNPITNVYVEMLYADTNNASLNFTGKYLRVDSIRQNMTRQPVVISLPRMRRSTPLDAMPQGYAIDFGSMNETITLNGTSLDGDNSRIANYVWMCQLARTGWFSTKADIANDSFKVAGGVRIGILDCGADQTDYGFETINTFDGTQWFQGVVTSFSASRNGGELKWDWQLTLTVASWPINATTFNTMYRTS